MKTFEKLLKVIILLSFINYWVKKNNFKFKKKNIKES
jgi:hypothetical protein